LLVELNKYFLRLVEADASDLEFQPPDGKWSGKEILGHLIDSAANNHQRFVRAQAIEHLAFQGYDQDDWVRSQNYRDRPWSEILNFWHQYNLHLVHVIRQIPEEILHRKCKEHSLDQTAFKPVRRSRSATLAYLIEDYIDHMVYHLNEVVGE
jgi:hypothetical protein